MLLFLYCVKEFASPYFLLFHTRHIHRLVLLVWVYVSWSVFPLFAQTSSSLSTTLTLTVPTTNTRSLNQIPTDTRATLTTTSATKRSNGMDTIVIFSARDSIIFSAKERVLKLRGNAFVNNKIQTLSAEQIDLKFEESTMEARSKRDSAGRIIGVPKFSDKGEEFYGDRLLYNFKTQRGLISLAETSLGEGFYFGDKIKRINESTLFAQDGCYTTCNQAHPHFYFKSPKMKLIANDRIFADPLIVYVEDIPIFAIPFGVFLENKTGRRSGLLVPTFFFNTAGGQNRGTIFQNLGYYFALSDYYDTQITADITTKGGYTIRNNWNYNVRDVLSGSIALSLGNVRFSPSDPYQRSWSVDVNHRQTIDPQTQLSGSLRFASTGFNLLNNVDLNSRAQQLITSNFSFSRNFDNGVLLSMSYSRTQNIRDGSVTENFPTASVTIPQFFPLRSLVSRDSWLSDVAITYGFNASRSFSRSAPLINQRTRDTVRTEQTSARIDHNPSINIAPRLGFFTLSPNISYRESWYFRRIADRRLVDIRDSTGRIQTQQLTDSIEHGFFREYNYSFGVGMSTRLFGIMNPRILGINSLRHTLTPSISYNFSPDFSRNSQLYGSYDEQYSTGDTSQPRQTRSVQYSRFSLDQGGFASRQLQQTLSMSLENNFEAKIAQGDTLPDKVVQLMNISISTSYNFVADSLKLAPITLGYRTSAGIFNINGGATFDPYDVQEIRRTTDPLRTAAEQQAALPSNISYERVNRLLISQGKGLARMTNFSFALQTSLSGTGFSAPASVQTTQQNKKLSDSTKRDSAGQAVGERFRARIDNIYEQNDLFGDATPGYTPLAIPWSMNFNANVNYTKVAPDVPAIISANVGMNFNLELGGWKMRSSLTYDVRNAQLVVPSIDITRTLHCWDLTFSWYPSGFSQGFYLRLGISSAMLRDIKIEKRDNPVFSGR